MRSEAGRENDMLNPRIEVLRLLALLAVSLLALGSAGSAEARTETLRWGHPDPEGEGVIGFRIYEKPSGTVAWTRVSEFPLSELTRDGNGRFSASIEVEDDVVLVFSLQAYGSDDESSLSSGRVSYPDTGAGASTGSFLGRWDFGEADDTAGWIDTGSNSLTVEPGLFEASLVDGNGALSTGVDAVNIHSHRSVAAPGDWTDYEYSGRMMTDSGSASLGVTAYSGFPDRDAYYRIRAITGGTFVLAPHPDGAFTMACVSADTGVSLDPDRWYRFRMQVRTKPGYTIVMGKVWRSEQSEPDGWSIDCLHHESDRLVGGTVGVWAMGVGDKYWDDLAVERVATSDDPKSTLLESPIAAPVLLE
jgi:hypothetical protein